MRAVTTRKLDEPLFKILTTVQAPFQYLQCMYKTLREHKRALQELLIFHPKFSFVKKKNIKLQVTDWVWVFVQGGGVAEPAGECAPLYATEALFHP